MIDLLDNCQFGNYKFLYLSLWTFAVRLDYGENKKSAHKFNYHWRGIVFRNGDMIRPPIWKFLT
jgi:hypothetical protein